MNSTEDILASVSRLRAASRHSLWFSAIGLVSVIGALYFSAIQLTRLQAALSEAKAELAQTTELLAAAAQKKADLDAATIATKAELDKTQKELEHLRQEITAAVDANKNAPQPSDTKALESALAKVNELKDALNTADIELERATAAKPPTADSPGIFIENFIQAFGTNDLDTQLRYYADPVDYYESGQIAKDIVRRDLQHDIATWPSRIYSIHNKPNITPTNDGFTAEFLMTYTLNNKKGMSSGLLQMTVHLRMQEQTPQITRIKKKVILARRQK